MPQVATFTIGDEIFGVDILLTKEIGKMQEITKIPRAPNFILGLMNLRGQIVTVMDPGVFLDQKTSVESDSRRLIILKTEMELETLRKKKLISDIKMSKDTLAIVIDEIGDVIEIPTLDILPPPPNLEGTKREFVSGVIQHGKKLVILLAMDNLAKMCILKT